MKNVNDFNIISAKNCFFTQLDIIVSTSCNMECRYCYQNNLKRSSCTLKEEYIKRILSIIIRDINEHKSFYENIGFGITILGGEAFLYPEVVLSALKVIYLSFQSLDWLNLSINIDTNASVLNEKIIDILHYATENFKSVKVNVSFDGIDQTAERTSNDSLTKRVRKNLSLIVKISKVLGYNVHIRTAITHKTYYNLYNSYTYIYNTTGIIPTFYWVKEEEKKEFKIFSEQIDKIANEISSSNEYIYQALKNDIFRISKPAVCNIYKRVLTILPTGDITWCSFNYFKNPEFIAGNIDTLDSIEEIRSKLKNIIQDKPYLISCSINDCEKCEDKTNYYECYKYVSKLYDKWLTQVDTKNLYYIRNNDDV